MGINSVHFSIFKHQIGLDYNSFFGFKSKLELYLKEFFFLKKSFSEEREKESCCKEEEVAESSCCKEESAVESGCCGEKEKETCCKEESTTESGCCEEKEKGSCC